MIHKTLHVALLLLAFASIADAQVLTYRVEANVTWTAIPRGPWSAAVVGDPMTVVYFVDAAVPATGSNDDLLYADSLLILGWTVGGVESSLASPTTEIRVQNDWTHPFLISSTNISTCRDSFSIGVLGQSEFTDLTLELFASRSANCPVGLTVDGLPTRVDLEDFDFGQIVLRDGGLNDALIAQVKSIDVLIREVATPYCFGNGGVTPGCASCPCGNDAGPSSFSGCMNSTGNSAQLRALGFSSVSRDSLRFELQGATPQSFALLVSGNLPLQQPNPCPTGSGVQSPILDGLRCVGGGMNRVSVRVTDLAGNAGVSTPGWGGITDPAGPFLTQNGLQPGQTRQLQCIYREGAGLGCLTGFNTSNALLLQVYP